MDSNKGKMISRQIEIYAILFGVNENIFDVKLRNDYLIKKLSLVPHISDLDRIYDVGAMELRRLFESAIVDDKLNVACACKTILIEELFEEGHDFSERVNVISNMEIKLLDDQIRTIRLVIECPIRFKDFVFTAYVIATPLNKNFTHYSKVPINEAYFSLGKNDSLKEIEIDFVNNNLDRFSFPLQDQLLNNCHILYDQSYYQQSNANSMLLLIICLEMLFLYNENSKKEKLSKRCAIFIGDNQQNIFEIYTNIRSFYEKRSDFVHEGISDSISGQDVLLLRDYVRKSLLKYLEDKLEKTELIVQLKQQILSSGYFPG